MCIKSKNLYFRTLYIILFEQKFAKKKKKILSRIKVNAFEQKNDHV